MYMKKLRAFDWLKNECILMEHECKVIAQVQITNSARARFQNSVCLDFCDVFSYTLLTIK